MTTQDEARRIFFPGFAQTIERDSVHAANRNIPIGLAVVQKRPPYALAYDQVDLFLQSKALTIPTRGE